MSESKQQKTSTPLDLFSAMGILLFVLLTFIGEGRLRLEDYTEVVHAFGAGGNHENLTTILRRSIDPNYLSGDIYADSLKYFFIPFVEGLKFFYGLGFDFNFQSIVLQWTGRIAYLTSIFYLCRYLVPSKIVPWIVFTFLIRSRLIIGEFPVLSYFDPNMEISMAFCLFSLLFFLKGKKELATCLASIGTIFHYRFPIFLLFFYLIWLVCYWRELSLRTILLSSFGAILFSLPLLYLMLPVAFHQTNPTENEIIRRIIFSAIANEFAPFTTLTHVWPRYTFLFFTSSLGAYYFYKSKDEYSKKTQRDLSLFLYFTIILTLFQFIFTEITLSLLFLQLQTNRILQIWIIIGTIWSSQWFLNLIEKPSNYKTKVSVLLFMICLFFSDTLFSLQISTFKIFPVFVLCVFFLLCVFIFSKNQTSNILNHRKTSLIFFLVFFFTTSGLFVARIIQNSSDRWKELDDWKSIQLWAKSNTPKDSVFFNPSGIGGFRIFSERTHVGALYDLHLSLSLDPSKTHKIHQRLNDIAFPILKSIDTRHLAWQKNSKRFESMHNELLNEEKYLSIIKKVKFDYIIRWRKKPLKFKEVYSNKSFIAYKIDRKKHRPFK